jgi:hypothetical protein
MGLAQPALISAGGKLNALGKRLGVDLPEAEIKRTVRYVNKRPDQRFSADSLGKQLMLIEDERTFLGITTIGSTTVSRAGRKRMRKQLNAERQRKRRRAKGAKPRGPTWRTPYRGPSLGKPRASAVEPGNGAGNDSRNVS